MFYLIVKWDCIGHNRTKCLKEILLFNKIGVC